MQDGGTYEASPLLGLTFTSFVFFFWHPRNLRVPCSWPRCWKGTEICGRELKVGARDFCTSFMSSCATLGLPPCRKNLPVELATCCNACQTIYCLWQGGDTHFIKEGLNLSEEAITRGERIKNLRTSVESLNLACSCLPSSQPVLQRWHC